MRSKWLLAPVAAVLVMVSGCELNPNYPEVAAAPSPTTPNLASLGVAPPVPVVPVVHLRFPAVGVYEKGAPGSYAGVARFSAETGTRIRIAMYYAGWGSSFKTAFAEQAARHGAVTDVMLEPWKVSVASIASGRQDKWLRSYAADIRAFRDPVILSFGHEMNGCWYPWGACKTPPSVFTAAWRHIVTVFREMKVRNVRWLWEVNVGRPAPLQSDYPGNSWVNLVGVTGYYIQPSSTFSNELVLTIDQIRRFSRRPLIVGETGVAPDEDRSGQIANLFAGLRSYHVQAVIYFDVDQSGGRYKQDWRLEGDAAALRGFRLAAKAYLTG